MLVTNQDEQRQKARTVVCSSSRLDGGALDVAQLSDFREDCGPVNNFAVFGLLPTDFDLIPHSANRLLTLFFAFFKKTQTISNDLTGRLIAPGFNFRLDKSVKMGRKCDVPSNLFGGHESRITLLS